MEFTLYRTLINSLYTEGSIYATNDNGLQDLYIPYTVESTENLILPGTYTLGIVKDPSTQTNKLTLLTCEDTPQPIVTIEAGHSYRTSRNNLSIVIGEQLIPGAVYCGRKFYNRLFERVEKARKRNTNLQILFYIIDDHLHPSNIYPHWLN